MTATGIRASVSVWPPARRQEPPDDAPSRARSLRSGDRDETRESPPCADIPSERGPEKAQGGAGARLA